MFMARDSVCCYGPEEKHFCRLYSFLFFFVSTFQNSDSYKA